MQTRRDAKTRKTPVTSERYAKPKKQKSSGVLIASSKLSDYHVLTIFRLYAEGASPAEVSRQVGVSYVTIQRIFDMMRKRLFLLGFYMPFDEFVALMDKREDVKGYWDKPHFFAYVRRKLRERKGVTEDTAPFHMAELCSRYVDEAFEKPGAKPTDFAEIVRLLRMSGPINRPPDIDRTLHALEYLLGRITDSHRRLDREVRVMLSRVTSGQTGSKP